VIVSVASRRRDFAPKPAFRTRPKRIQRDVLFCLGRALAVAAFLLRAIARQCFLVGTWRTSCNALVVNVVVY